MKGFKSKRGISLIVLVITIIVMIILAAAIILSISNSGIMDKANKAKTDSDTANLKEYVNVLTAEWELGTKETSKETYVNSKLEEKGYTGALLMEDGTLYTNLQANTKTALKAGIQIGDTVTGYNAYLTSKTVYTSGDENTYEASGIPAGKTQVSNKTNFEWKFMGISDNGEIMLLADNIDISCPCIQLSGIGGYLNGAKELNDICEKLYGTSKGTARSMNIDDVTNLLGYTGEKGAYYDTNAEYVPTKVTKTIGEIEDLIGTDLSHRNTPDNTDISNYIVDYYEINKTNDINDITNSVGVDLVYQYYNYVLASSCCYLSYGDTLMGPEARWGLRIVSDSSLDMWTLYTSGGSFYDTNRTLVVRPVVHLNSDASVSYSDGTLTLN